MNLPSNVRSLFAFGVFCAVGGAWLTLVTEVRTLPLRTDFTALSAAPASPSRRATSMSKNSDASLQLAPVVIASPSASEPEATSHLRAGLVSVEEAGDQRVAAAQHRELPEVEKTSPSP